MGPGFLLQPAAETGKLYPLPLLLEPQRQRKAGLVRVWIWDDWGLGNGDKRMCLSCIGLDILHDYFQFRVRSPLTEATARNLVG